MMKVKVHNLWQYIGITIRVVEDITEYVPKGNYLVLGKDLGGCIELGNLLTRETTLIEDYDEDDELLVVDYKVNLDELVEFKLASCVHLIKDGWTINGGMDLTPYISDYMSLITLQKIKDR